MLRFPAAWQVRAPWARRLGPGRGQLELGSGYRDSLAVHIDSLAGSRFPLPLASRLSSVRVIERVFDFAALIEFR